MSEIKLKPCPFCGGSVKKRIAPLMGTVMFVCEKCGADVCFYGAEHEPKATLAWNRRKDEDVVRCKDCIYREQADGDYGDCYYCALTKCDVGENDYCGQAERSEK